jgi:hypothetical protein
MDRRVIHPFYFLRQFHFQFQNETFIFCEKKKGEFLRFPQEFVRLRVGIKILGIMMMPGIFRCERLDEVVL